jgi:excisionase family DNA binding protein
VLDIAAASCYIFYRNYKNHTEGEDMDTLTTAEVARLLEVSEGTVRNLIDNGELPAIRMTDTGWRRVYRSDLEAYAVRRSIRINWDVLKQ